MGLTAARRIRSAPRPSRVAALTAAALVGAAPARTAAQESGAVRAARVEVDLRTPAEGAAVRVEFDVLPGPDGLVPVELLERPGSTGIEVRRDGGAPLSLRAASGSKRTGTVDPRSGAPNGGVRLVFEYSVPVAVREEGPTYAVHVPVLGVSLPPVAEGGDLFSVVVSTPERWSVVDGFPSGLRRVAPGRHEATLPVVPSMIGLRGRTDGSWRPGIDLAVELSTLAVLLAFLGVGWRRLGGRFSGAER